MNIILPQNLFATFKMWLLIIILITTQSYDSISQIRKNQWMIGGNAEFSYYKYYTIKTSSLSLSPSGGYFLFDRLALGLRPSYIAEFFQSGGKSRESLISISPFIRYYFLSDERKVNIFADVGFGYSWGKFKNYTYPDFTYHSKIISFKAGPAIFLNERTALEITIGYNHSIKGPLGDTLGVKSLQIGIGLQIHIGKRSD